MLNHTALTSNKSPVVKRGLIGIERGHDKNGTVVHNRNLLRKYAFGKKQPVMTINFGREESLKEVFYGLDNRAGKKDSGRR